MFASRRSGCVAPTLVFALLLSMTVAATAQDPPPVDRAQARELLRKERSGQPLTDAERAALDRAKATRRARQPDGERPAGRRGRGDAPEPRASTGLVPLTDMGPDDRYHGRTGGLYGGGRNDPPADHLAAAMQAAAVIRPLDERGRPDPAGRIGVISVGMSNTTREFGQFIETAAKDRRVNPAVVLVDGAQSGQDVADWANPAGRTRAGQPDAWQTLAERLDRAGLAAAQVQVVWIKQARRLPAEQGEFPAHTDEFNRHLTTVLNRLKATYPNLKLAYLSSRIYGGYADSPLSPEPYAYEYGLAIQELIAAQIAGEPALNADPERGAVRAPILLWGPYLWADGEIGRSDGLVWTRQDMAKDGTHPGAGGRKKVAALLLKFFNTDPTTRGWFVRGE